MTFTGEQLGYDIERRVPTKEELKKMTWTLVKIGQMILFLPKIWDNKFGLTV